MDPRCHRYDWSGARHAGGSLSFNYIASPESNGEGTTIPKRPGARPETTGPQDCPMVRRQPRSLVRVRCKYGHTGQPGSRQLATFIRHCRHCGRDWPSRIRAIAAVAENKKQDQSKRTMVLSDIRDLFSVRADADRVRLEELPLRLAKWKTVLGPSGATASP